MKYLIAAAIILLVPMSAFAQAKQVSPKLAANECATMVNGAYVKVACPEPPASVKDYLAKHPVSVKLDAQGNMIRSADCHTPFHFCY